MRQFWFASIFVGALVTVALAARPAAVEGQSTTSTPSVTSPPPKPSAAKKATGQKRTRVIPMETAPAAPVQTASPDKAVRQKAADQALLQQQQAQSNAAAKATDQQVQQAQKQIDRQQNEVRIQDAPGPAQTGVVPSAGPPVAPVNASDRIQEAPGPAQTLPPLAQPQPSAQPAVPQTSTPTTQPPL